MTSSNSQIVLVTGGTGFIGSHVISQLLEAGYVVHATTRPGKSSVLTSTYPDVKPGALKVFEVADLTADHSAALEGVSALLHIASPVFGRGDSSSEIAKGAYDGSLSVVNQAIKAGVKKVIATSSNSSWFEFKDGPDFSIGYSTKPITPETFGSTKLEDLDLNTASEMVTYAVAKLTTELKFWEVAEDPANAGVDFTCIVPPYVLGPFIPNYQSPNVGTNSLLLGFLTGSYPAFPMSYTMDVRDVASSYLRALKVGPLPSKQRKRFLLCSKIFTLEEIASIIRTKRPELKDKLPKEGEKPPVPPMFAPVDTSLVEEYLGLKEGTVKPFEDTVLGALDAALAWQEKQGGTV